MPIFACNEFMGNNEMRIPTEGPVSEFLSFLLSKEETKKTTNI